MKDKIGSKNFELKKAEKIPAILINWAVWDALWLPVETKTKQEIQDILHKSSSKIDFYLPSWWNIYFIKAGLELSSREVWKISDDTILTMAVMKSITEKKTIDLYDIMEKTMQGYDKFPYGFWGATRKAIKHFREHKDINKLLSIESSSMWCGVTMKQAPLTLWDAPNREIIDFTKLTHNSYPQKLASIIHDIGFRYILNSSWNINVEEFLEYMTRKIRTYEELTDKKSAPGNDTLEWQELKKIRQIFEKMKKFSKSWKLIISDDEILENFWRGDDIKKSGQIATTLAITYSIFLREQSFQAIIDSVSIWWDTDSYWSIVWNMVWALSWEIPERYYIENLENFEEIEIVANEFKNLIIQRLW